MHVYESGDYDVIAARRSKCEPLSAPAGGFPVWVELGTWTPSA
jgi:hypothetical protein